MAAGALSERTAQLGLRAAVALALAVMLVHSPRQEEAFRLWPFLLAGLYAASALALWAAAPRLRAVPGAAGAALLWDVAAATLVAGGSEGFENELFLVYFLVLFMAATVSRPGQAFLVAGVAGLVYAGLWSRGAAGRDLPLVNLLLRLAFLQAAALFSAAAARGEGDKEERRRSLELRFALKRLANGGWGLAPPEALDPDTARTVRALDALLDNMSTALRRVLEQNDSLRAAASGALLQLAREKERLEAAAGEAAGRRRG